MRRSGWHQAASADDIELQLPIFSVGELLLDHTTTTMNSLNVPCVELRRTWNLIANGLITTLRTASSASLTWRLLRALLLPSGCAGTIWFSLAGIAAAIESTSISRVFTLSSISILEVEFQDMRFDSSFSAFRSSMSTQLKSLSMRVDMVDYQSLSSMWVG